MPDTNDQPTKEATPFKKFEELAKRLVAVPKKRITEPKKKITT